MRELVPGDQGVLVQYVQLALRRAGYPVKIDGIFGEGTCASLRAFLGGVQACQVEEAQWNELLPYLKGYTTYQVKEGDTFWEIANRLHSSVRRMMAANPTADPASLQAGTVLLVPFDFPLVSEEVPYSSLLTDWILEGLQVRYPFLREEPVGDSVMGQKLSVIRIGEGKKQVFYNASFHANEWITTPVLLKFAEEYAQAFAMGLKVGGVPASWLYYGFSLSLLPLVNPDGVDLVNGILDDPQYLNNAVQIAAGYPDIPFPQGWKANIDGIDLNLQFPAGWETAKEVKYAQGYRTPAPRDFVGEAPLSAPESRAVYDYTKRKDFSLILAYHTQGEVIYWKYLDYEPEGSYRIARYFQEVSGYAVEETPGASGNAGYKDWFIKEYNRPGYTIEAGSGVNPLQMEQFAKIYEDNLGILVGGMTQLA
ncbi:MAG: LysM peptidoglycan-binding domain-containing protein [Eubacterium sp.]|nr:LysM peptidoglycan-binding domain-containing protein [Eubacterium sp.]